jgi:hypothetical protein
MPTPIAPANVIKNAVAILSFMVAPQQRCHHVALCQFCAFLRACPIFQNRLIVSEAETFSCDTHARAVRCVLRSLSRFAFGQNWTRSVSRGPGTIPHRWPCLHRHAQEASWREDCRRLSNAKGEPRCGAGDGSRQVDGSTAFPDGNRPAYNRPDGSQARQRTDRANDPRQHAGQRRAVARRVIAVSPSSHSRGSSARVARPHWQEPPPPKA